MEHEDDRHIANPHLHNEQDFNGADNVGADHAPPAKKTKKNNVKDELKPGVTSSSFLNKESPRSYKVQNPISSIDTLLMAAVLCGNRPKRERQVGRERGKRVRRRNVDDVSIGTDEARHAMGNIGGAVRQSRK